MANKKITELNEATSVSGNDWLVIVDVANDETKKVHANQVGGNIPIQDTAPQNPEEDDLWIDTSEPEEYNEPIDYYSTSEVKTNKIWIDGKPIYRKVITGTTATQNTFGTYAIDSNLKEPTSIEGFIKVGSTHLPIAYSNTGAPCFYLIDGTNLLVQVGNSGFASKDLYAIVEYTKTTD